MKKIICTVCARGGSKGVPGKNMRPMLGVPLLHHTLRHAVESGIFDAIAVSSPKIAKPVAVRYAWADNPVCNLYSKDGLPVTPFRTDDFKMITEEAVP